MEKTKGKFFYGWYVVAAGCAVVAMTMGIMTNCFGQFIKPVCADMGFSRQAMSVNQTIMSVVQMLMALMWGSISKKIKLHRWMCASALLTPAFYFCYSFASNIYMFYAVTILTSLSYCLISMMVFTYIVGNWFVKDRGVAIGMCSMGSGIGAMVMNTVISQMIINWGWRHTYQVLGVMIFVVIVPCVFFVIREKPSDKGLVPYGFGEHLACDGDQKKPFEGYTFAEVRKMKSFWAIALTSIGMVMSIGIFYQTLSPHLSDNGYSVTFAAVMASISMGALAVGKVILGKLFDGLGCSFGAICMPIITQNVFGMKDYNSIYGKLSAATGLGGAFAPIISGRVYDTFGSYVPAYIVCAGMVFAGIFVLMIALPKKDNA